jgi:tetratricopeptide (TPR) repeat protein
MLDQPLRTPVAGRWARAEHDESYWMVERRRRRWRLLAVAALVVVLVGGGGATLVLQARANYLNGQRALAAGEYGLAIQQLSAARVAGLPYADAHKLLNDAVALSIDQSQYASQVRDASRPTAASRALRQAAALFAGGHYSEALARLAGLPSRLPPAVAAARLSAGSGVVGAVLLLVSANEAFAAHDWRVARYDAAGVLARYPRCAPAAALAAEAGRRTRAEPFAVRAAGLAAAGRWKAALGAVRRALRIDPTYPGAAALLARVDATLARRKAAKAKTAAAKSAATATTPSAPSYTPPPVAPKPTPKPPPPPP